MQASKIAGVATAQVAAQRKENWTKFGGSIPELQQKVLLVNFCLLNERSPDSGIAGSVPGLNSRYGGCCARRRSLGEGGEVSLVSVFSFFTPNQRFSRQFLLTA